MAFGEMPTGDGVEGAPLVFSPGRFDGQVVLITGAVQGIGLAVANRIAHEGAQLFLVDRSELVKDVADTLKERTGTEIGWCATDLEQFDGAAAMVKQAVDMFGRIDVAINNVGGTIWAKPFEHYSPDEIEKEIQRSLFTTLWSVRAELPALIGAGGGTIVNVSSVATRGVNRVPYAAAKGGVNAITAALAKEAASKNVRVVATAPGGTEAPARVVKRGPSPEDNTEKEWYQQIVDQTIESSEFKRYGTLGEQAAPIAFLASREASYITGSVLPVGGGDQG